MPPTLKDIRFPLAAKFTVVKETDSETNLEKYKIINETTFYNSADVLNQLGIDNLNKTKWHTLFQPLLHPINFVTNNFFSNLIQTQWIEPQLENQDQNKLPENLTATILTDLKARLAQNVVNFNSSNEDTLHISNINPFNHLKITVNKIKRPDEQTFLLEATFSGRHEKNWHGLIGTGCKFQNIPLWLCYQKTSPGVWQCKHITYDEMHIATQIGAAYKPLTFLSNIETILLNPRTIMNATFNQIKGFFSNDGNGVRHVEMRSPTNT